MHYVLFYDVVEDYATKRTPFRSEHLALARQAEEQAELVMGGAFAEPVDGAMLIFRSPESAEKFVADDPYVKNGLVTSWKIRHWNVVIGDGTAP